MDNGYSSQFKKNNLQNPPDIQGGFVIMCTYAKHRVPGECRKK